jgi:hypothetical protein
MVQGVDRLPENRMAYHLMIHVFAEGFWFRNEMVLWNGMMSRRAGSSVRLQITVQLRTTAPPSLQQSARESSDSSEL